MNNLSVSTFPLYGQSLIEASAGTGKTHTITALYNRLMLGHRADRLGCDQILVVTFTRAATEELRGRIRQRVRDSFSDMLRLDNNQPALDSQLEQYISDIAQENEIDESLLRQQLTPWLQANLALMDEASIFTIHAFCQRILKQFAFDSGVMFSADLVIDSESYLKQACEDVWRHYAYALNTEQSAYLLTEYSGPDDLLKKARTRINRPDVVVLPKCDVSDYSSLWDKAHAAFKRVEDVLITLSPADFYNLIQNSGLNKRSYNSKNTANWIEQTYQYFTGEFHLPFEKNVARFTLNDMASKYDSGKGDMPNHAVFTLISDFCEIARALSVGLKDGWQADIKERYFTLLEQSGALTPNDLLRLLEAALLSDQGYHLARQIRNLYPIAMIDEFQDTDPQQYTIFKRIYAEEKGKHGLIMIGDPKQAIYAFRGADIFTYIRARRELDDSRRFTLDTNWRSHSQLIDGVNTVFSQHQSPFIYDADIQFYAVNASGKHDKQAFSIGGESQLPLQFMCDGMQYSRTEAQSVAARQCAEKIASSLGNPNITLGTRAVIASDIAVLVRSHQQAQKIRIALSDLGIGSVFLSRESVFKSQEAIDLFSWLNAVVNPTNERVLRAALATVTQGYSSQQLNDLLQNEGLWEIELQRYCAYQELWYRRGIMAALMNWLEHDDLAVQLRQYSDGERRLTNLMHLGELLQHASRKLRGHEALLRWLGERVFTDVADSDDSQLRLESDANLVSIVTIHKSKGLQYPLVFLPYLWDDDSEPKSSEDTIFFDEKTNSTVLCLNPDENMKAEAHKALLAENLRLLYVALTRAEQGCFVWLLDAHKRKDAKERKSRIATTALGYLLQLTDTPDWAALKEHLGPNILLDMQEWPKPIAEINAAETQALPQAMLLSDRQRDYWRVGSYSQLVSEHGEHEILDVLRTDELLVQDISLEPLVNNTLSIEFNADHVALTFVKGADAGTCLHAIFERWDFSNVVDLFEITAAELRHYGLYQDESQVVHVCEWLHSVVRTPLFNPYAESFCLADINTANRLDEMEFYMGVKSLHPKKIDALLGSSKRFSFDQLEGYLKGFIDLIFCHEGRYYIADYKSNHLGSSIQDYAPLNVGRAMLEHAYDLQAWIYTLALDKLLANRIPNYSPETHLGGVYYFFIRGMHLGDSSPIMQNQNQRYLQMPGVYYHSVDVSALNEWKKVFAGVSA